ncbi:MAG TPA: ABC transporter ATP-binding protein [Ktedonobacterales bacterium]|nr:ABC transporter ATP-binding protein [Ktedonobacterales bacterium]
MGKLLRAENLGGGYDGPPIIHDITIEARPGEITIILGPNGAGKSTCAKAMVGLLPSITGKVFLDNSEVTRLKPYQLIHRGIGYLPQMANVFDAMTVMENLEMGGFTLRGGLDARIKEVLDLFPDLSGVLSRKAAELSGGQQRMVAMARAMMTRPEAMILDEPTAGLSPLYTNKVWDRISDIKTTGVTLLVIEQNARTALEHADIALVITNGTVTQSGAAAVLMEEESVKAALAGL